MNTQKIGYEYRGFKLGARVKFNGDLRTIIAFHLDESDEVFIAINKKYHSCIRDSSVIDDMVVLEGHEYSEYMWISKERIEIKEEVGDIVLEIEYIEIFDEKYVVKISKQNEEILPRNNFSDNDLDVYSCNYFSYSNGELFLRGQNKNEDDRVIIVSKEQFLDIVEKVRLINEKYGKHKNFRAEEDDYYFYIDDKFKITETLELFYSEDNTRYEIGNYFKTKEIAEEYVNKIKNIFKGEL